MARTRIDIQIDAAIGLLTNYAALFPQALHHIDVELRAIDGFASMTMSDGMPRGDSVLTSVERGADERLRIGAIRSQLIDDRDTILALISSALHVCRDAIGTRAPVAVARCRDHQPGRDGVIEWGRADCEDLPAKSGLCSACYWRETRWRRSHSLPARDVVAIAS